MIYQTNSKIPNPKSQIPNSKQQGITLLLAILLLSSILAISFSLAAVLFIQIRSSGDLLKTEPALYAATGVGEEALFDQARHACTDNGSECYTANFFNNVTLPNTPTVLASSTPIFIADVKAGSTFSKTLNNYYFCASLGSTGCGYGQVTLNYITTTSDSASPTLYVYLCQFDPNPNDPNTNYFGVPCTATGTPASYSPYWPDGINLDGSVSMTSTINNPESWALTPGDQQQLILTNPGTSDIYVQIETFASDGVTPKGLPYVGETAIDVSTQNASVGRKIQVVVPNSSGPGNSSGSGSTGGTATHFSVAANPATVTAGVQSANGLTVTALDVNGNTVTGYSGTVYFTSTDGSASLPANSTLTNGVGTFSFTLNNTNGTQTITATDSSNGTITGTSNNITVNSATNGYAYYRQLTVQGSQISTVNHTSLSNFTVLVSATLNAAHVVNPNGYDIIFTSDPGCSQLLNWEMENYSSGSLVAWVKMASALSHTSNTTFYMCYGKSGISSFQGSNTQGSNTGSAWDGNYKAVWHLPNGSSLSAADSTSNGNNGTNNGFTPTSGQIDGAGLTNGSSNISFPNLSLANTPYTVSAWIYKNDANDFNIVGGGAGGVNNNAHYIVRSSHFYFGNYACDVGGNQTINPNQWYYVAFVMDSSAQQSIYVNGALDAGPSYTCGYYQSYVTWIGSSCCGGPGAGTIDEVRISNTARSADWINTEYNNQNNPSSFCSVGPEL
jgi:hypothetical protein